MAGWFPKSKNILGIILNVIQDNLTEVFDPTLGRGFFMTGMGSARLLASMALVCGALMGTAAPAQAGRRIVIDTADQLNTLRRCGPVFGFVDCPRYETAVGFIMVSPFGSITLTQRNNATFRVIDSSTRFSHVSGWSPRSDVLFDRVERINFYSEDTVVIPDPDTNELPLPDFQITLQNRYVSDDIVDLEIGFAYLGTNVPAGARIGYEGLTPNAGFPSARYVTHSNRLLLGQSPSDSDFFFVLRSVQDGPTSLIFEQFSPAFAGVPEPASWAMMILGFGLVGNGARVSRRRARQLAA